MRKQKISSFRLPHDLDEGDLSAAFELSDHIGVSYSESQVTEVDFYPYCKEEVYLLLPGLKIIFFAGSEIVFVVPVETRGSVKKACKAMEDAFKLNKFLGKTPVISITDGKLTICESEE